MGEKDKRRRIDFRAGDADMVAIEGLARLLDEDALGTAVRRAAVAVGRHLPALRRSLEAWKQGHKTALAAAVDGLLLDLKPQREGD